MAYHHSAVAATFVPGGFDDDYYMPPAAPELISPEPQRFNPEMPQQIQHGLQHMSLNATVHPMGSSPLQSPTHPPASDNDVPNFSPFPKLANRPPGVPQSDEELEATLENARAHVLNSNDPEMQLAWAADALMYVGVCADEEERLVAANSKAARPSTPRIEHQLKSDAMSVVAFLADQHHPRAEFLKGMWLEWGRFGQREDKKEAFRCYSRAADRGFARAEYRIGMLYESYNDPIKALRHYNRGVEAGDAASCYRLGMMTLRGQHGQQQDYRKALELIQQSADKADENAAQGAYVYGMLLARQLPQIEVPESILPSDERSARTYIEKAAFHRFAKAQLKMGSAYELGGLGCEFNPALSVHYNALAAKQGESEAEMALSKWFLVGSEGLFPKNEELAYVYAERAAHGGLAIGEFALGYFFEIGVHVPVNIDKAQEWYKKAAQHGNKDASARIEALANKQVLNKKDHENVAISRIKSQYGSVHGGRPERFQQRQPQNGNRLETITQYSPVSPTVYSPESSYSPSIVTAYGVVSPQSATSAYSTAPDVRNSAVPARGTTPYPMDDPPHVVAPLNANRPTSVAPYPLEDRPSSTPVPNPNSYQSRPPPRLGPTGGFFNPAGAGPPSNGPARPTSAFQLNPELRNNGFQQPLQTAPLPNRPSTVQPQAPPQQYNHGGPGGPQGGYNSNFRPTLNQGGRIASGPAGMQNWSGHPPPQQQQQQQHPRPGGPQDIGFAAPIDTHRPAYASSPAQAPQKQYGPRPIPNSNLDSTNSQRPTSHPNPQSSKPKPKPLPPNPTNVPASTNAPTSASAPPSANSSSTTNKPSTPASTPLPQKGPKTFEEMGVPASKKESECTIM
ncbi:Hypothetical protein R9X50_00719400 [Acrodontium crateriforme]|uniref:HCP-like protein n=1 Tax=Acrodontium crateriforme TaxID=150365 RepID=A0AAQ3RCM1_9PEZI|nr:Hypothetical protein R9X50_00719400 [Acrodontium crateriforme]